MVEFLLGVFAGMLLVVIFAIIDSQRIDRKIKNARRHLWEAIKRIDGGDNSSIARNSIILHLRAADGYLRSINDQS